MGESIDFNLLKVFCEELMSKTKTHLSLSGHVSPLVVAIRGDCQEADVLFPSSAESTGLLQSLSSDSSVEALVMLEEALLEGTKILHLSSFTRQGTRVLQSAYQVTVGASPAFLDLGWSAADDTNNPWLKI